MEQDRTRIETGTSGIEASEPDPAALSPDELAPVSDDIGDMSQHDESVDASTAERRSHDADLGLRFGEKVVDGVVKARPKPSSTQTW